MKRYLRVLAALLCAAAILPAAAPGTAALSAQCAIVVDADSGRVLFEQDADRRCLIASTTKIMTGYLACLRCDLDAPFTVPPEAVGVEGSSIYLQEGETLPVRALLYGTLLQSGNDAATALAIAACGSTARFVEEMNAEAQTLGLRNTHFSNPHGLDSEDNYSTARELAELTRAALREPAFAEAVATKTASFGARSFVNHNKLLWRCEGVIGVKTGFTKAAGRILVSALRRGGRTLIAVTVRAPDDWNDHVALYDEALAQYADATLATEGQPLCLAPVAAGASVWLIAAESRSYLLLDGEQLTYLHLPPALPLPPFPEGEDAGAVQILLDGRPVATVPVCWGPAEP